MKIVLISFLFEESLGGGAEKCVNTLVKGLSDRKINITVISSGPNHKLEVHERPGFRLIRFLPRNLYWVLDKDKQPLYKKIIWQLIDIWNPFVYRTTRKILEIEKPEIVHVHKLRGLSPSVWSASNALDIPKIIHTCHDYELISPEGWLNGRVGNWADNRAFVMRPYQFLRAQVSFAITHASAPSKYVLEKHIRMGFFRKSKTQIVPNSHGYDDNHINLKRNLPVNKSRHSLRLLFLGRLVPEKGIIELCEAVRKSRKHFPDLTLDVIGWGILEEILVKKYAHLGKIHFHGATFGEKKERLINESDVIVAPSIGPESFGIVLVEAYAFGKPVIASRIGGIPEVVKEGETGFLVKPGDVDDLAEKIQTIASDPSLLDEMRDACFDAALNYTTERITKKYLEFYEM